jgi:uncharacterized protein (DUF488 family)
LEIYTIGHSNRSFEQFLSLLGAWKIQNLVDVRTAPSSRYLPHFNRLDLERELPKAGVQYFWMKELGGFRREKHPVSPNAGLRSPGFRAYADYMLTQEFLQAIEKLFDIARQGRTAIMCAEALYFRCHRKLISDFLVANGISVFHISTEDSLIPHKLAPYARVQEGTVTYPPPT